MSDDLVKRLRENCAGQPATVPWPHRVLHEAADRIEQLEADKRALVEALEKISANSTDKEDPNLSSSDSFGNSDDVFSDGMRQADYYTAQIARETLAKHGGAR